MVLYHEDGRVVQAHEDYLEQAAAKDAETCKFDEQINECKKHDPNAAEVDMRAYIVIDDQNHHTLYSFGKDGALWEEIAEFKVENATRIPDEGIDRTTLMKCSSTADDYFSYNTDEEDLHLPVKHPRLHDHGSEEYREVLNNKMAYIRAEEILKYIVPWLTKMEKHFRRLAKRKDAVSKKPDDPASTVAPVEIPDDLLEKIHLYNAMLQLGLPSFIQRPLIDALVAQMYQTPLDQCHLDTLEITVARFYSRGVPVLDPVLSHFIGTYSFRSIQDRSHPGPERPDRTEPSPESIDEGAYDFRDSNRGYLNFTDHIAGRKNYPKDTIILPPKLPVLAHSIKHWSGIRKNGSTAAAYTGYPLNVGTVMKYYRRDATDPIRTARRHEDFEKYSTYRLRNDPRYKKSPP